MKRPSPGRLPKVTRPGLQPVIQRLGAPTRRALKARPLRHLFFVLAVAGAVVVLDQVLRPLAEASLTGARIPLLGGRVVLERLDDPATVGMLAVLRFHLVVGLAALLLMALLSRFMGWYGIALLAAFGLILGGAESNHLSLLAYGFVLNWIGYRIDGPVTVFAPADLVQMAGLAVVTSALSLFTAVTLWQLLPDEWRADLLRSSAHAAISSRDPALASDGEATGRRWDRRLMIGAR